MEPLLILNDRVWEAILSVTGNISDNLIFTIFFASGAFSLLLLLFRARVKNVFLIPEGIYLISLSAMTRDIPVIHERVTTALDTVCTILRQSGDYMDGFLNVSGLKNPSDAEIASYLYYLEDPSIFEGVQPSMLYEKLFSTLDQISVHKVIHPASLLYAIILIIILFVFVLGTEQISKKLWTQYIAQCVILILAAQYNFGTFLGAAVISLAQFGLGQAIYHHRKQEREA
ncbi:hypothetical protein LKD70_09115 [Ruminococcus sp. CLA-AA-H200]|uniref:Uncharacterized protein n=1 Tax=Ruminococcus turbiniformis TaxID=2881258 RepID=A0ABS8FYB5_9FIRM|nr:hypothetical protein [Ruminococcus turbiniformis]MCC2254574.1 hypothetical protein [Ruminococcus turbiniformis]